MSEISVDKFDSEEEQRILEFIKEDELLYTTDKVCVTKKVNMIYICPKRKIRLEG